VIFYYLQLFYIIFEQEQYGITGVMEFQKLSYCGFDPWHSFVIDPMHAIFLGVCKLLAEFHFHKKWIGQPFNIHAKLPEVDERMANIAKQVPFVRAPRGFRKNFVHYKGIRHN